MSGLVGGFTGSSLWSYVAGYPAPTLNVISAGLKDFARKHAKDGMVKIIETYTGASAKRDRRAKRLHPGRYPPGLGEQAAHSVYLNTAKSERPAVFLHNDEDAANLFRAKRLDVHLLTPFAFLLALEKTGKIESAETLWKQIETHFAGITKQQVDASLRGGSDYLTRIRRAR